MLLLGLFSLLSSVVTSALAYNQAVSLSFYSSEVSYWPDTAWHQTLNNPCGTIDHYTSMVGARITVNFTGNRIVVGGMRNNHSGLLSVTIDNESPWVQNMYSRNVTCDTYFDYYLLNGTHTLTMTLSGISPSVADGSAVMHFMEMTYWTPIAGTPAEVPTASSVAGGVASSSSHSNVKAIVVGTIGGVVGLAAIIFAVFWFLRKRLPKRNDRHSFNPNLAYVTQLPRLGRTTTMDTMDNEAKFQPYAKMEDEPTDTKATLQVPTSTLQVPPSGLRSRSRSPAPDRKPFP